MTGARDQRKPVFIGQAILILLPVAVLSTMGWLALRQDKILARHDAVQRAQAIAESLVPKVWAEINRVPDVANPTNRAFEVDADWRLDFPPARDSVPVPHPFDVKRLNADQARLWSAIQRAESEPNQSADAIKRCRDFIASNPPDEFAISAQYELGVLLSDGGDAQSAATEFRSLAARKAEALTESGVPLQPLAQFKWLELSERVSLTNPVSLDAACSNILAHPSVLTPILLRQIGSEVKGAAKSNSNSDRETISKWQHTWESQELARQLFAAASAQIPKMTSPSRLLSAEDGGAAGGQGISTTDFVPQVFWFDTPERLPSGVQDGLPISDDRWIAVGVRSSPSNRWFVCRPASELGAMARMLVKYQPEIPDYFGVGVRLLGDKLNVFGPDLRVWQIVRHGGKEGSLSKEISETDSPERLASASDSQIADGALSVDVYLTSPATLYAHQRKREYWFGSLIATSTLAALVGLFAAWRAFKRQRNLVELKSNFVASVSHELRAPIASVRLMAESLERGKLSGPAKQREYFRFIVQECRRLSSLIENVLDFSRIEQGRKRYEFEPTDIGALVRETVKLMEPYAAEKGVRLELKTSNIQHRTSNIEMNVDGRAIQQALINLIDNAIKHSPKGEAVTVAAVCDRRQFQEDDGQCKIEKEDRRQSQATATVEAESQRLSQTAATIQISVADHGPGIPPEEHKKIFEKFYRRGSELRRETQGVGIGLSIVKHIVEAHGGRVRVESEAGRGSCFTIELLVNKSEIRNPKSE